MRLLKLKRVWLIILIIAGYLALSSCETSNVILQTAPKQPSARHISPAITAKTLPEWEAQRNALIQSLERDIYGTFPPSAIIKSIEKTPLIAGVYKGQARSESWAIAIDIPREDGQTISTQFNLSLILPISEQPAPVITMQTFCPRHSTLPNLGIKARTASFCESKGFGARVMFYIFGRYISTPPIEDILARGYGIAAMYPTALIPDNAVSGRTAMTRLFGPSPLGSQHDASAVGGWAYLWAAAADALSGDAAIDAERIAAFGHSRYGKSALVASLWSDNISAIVSHQSGTGGASLSRGKKGESVTQIIESYPHWFAPAYLKYDSGSSIETEQHHLLALQAPKPVLLGNARRDVWSDPEGAFHAAYAADKIYELYGKDGLTVETLNRFDPNAKLSYWLRNGTHGIVKEDWPAFLSFLDAHFKR